MATNIIKPNMSDSPRKHIVFGLTVSSSLYYLYAVVRNAAESSRFLLFLSGDPNGLAVIAAHYCRECLHTCVCANGSRLL